MNLKAAAGAVSVALAATVAASSPQDPAERWWAHVNFLATDEMNGRDTGTPEHRRAAEYVAEQFKRAQLKPGGTAGYFQRVTFTSRRIVEEKSSLELLRPDGGVERVVLGDDVTFSMRIQPASYVEAPIVFAGYGLQVPEVGHDDLAGLDLKGKIVMHLTGGPAKVTGPLLAHYQSTRWEYLKKAGALGVFSIQNPKGQDVPWERSKLARLSPQLTLTDESLDETAGQAVSVTINPEKADKFLAGSNHTVQSLLALSNEGKELPRFAIPSRARIRVATDRRPIASDNVIGILEGKDPSLRNEYLVLSAHLDHLGIGGAIAGDRIYNGAMDNASGIATLIEAAAAAAAAGGYKRSIIFAAVTAEEKGLLGSRYYANRPTVAKGSIVANVNTDMFLPLFPLKSIIVQGLEESDLAEDLKRVAGEMGIQVLSDPEPERRAFVRSDQYSFIKTGVPALSLKVGFVKDSPEHQIVKKWRTERYHAPSDDLSQPIDRQAAVDFGRVFLRVVESIANRPTRPQWNHDSFFRRFAQQAPGTDGGIQDTKDKRQGTWSASAGTRASGPTLGGTWTAAADPATGAVSGTWTLIDEKGRVLIRGAWSAAKSPTGWTGSWRAIVDGSKGEYAGTWRADVKMKAGARFADLFEAAANAAVGGTWRADRRSGRWSIRASE